MRELRHRAELRFEEGELRSRQLLIADGLQGERALRMQIVADAIDDAHAAFADEPFHSIASVHAAANGQGAVLPWKPVDVAAVVIRADNESSGMSWIPCR